MLTTPRNLNRLLAVVVEHLDIPKSYYEKAAARHRNLGEWLQRPESKLRQYDPDVRPQGSFRFGTVIRPLDDKDEYDLDNVTVLKLLKKTDMTQKELKNLFGVEIKAYAAAHNMKSPAVEHHRCWRLHYADEAPFHLDALPCVPEDAAHIAQLIAIGVPVFLAECAVAITDRRHPQYDRVTSAWLSSNPRGFARWFEQRAALGRPRKLSEGRAKSVVEDVPPYEWKTPLQQSIQLLKRHRDVMFEKNPELAPISMIITNLAARAYDGETDLWEALSNIVEEIAKFVQPQRPRVPNPADPAEDYADKWSRNPALEQNFWIWLTAVKAAVASIPAMLNAGRLARDVYAMFRVDLTQDELSELETGRGPSVVVKAAPTLILPTAPRPWGGR